MGRDYKLFKYLLSISSPKKALAISKFTLIRAHQLNCDLSTLFIDTFYHFCVLFIVAGSDTRQKLMYDLYYFKNWSISMEIKTIFKTIQVMLKGEGL